MRGSVRPSRPTASWLDPRAEEAPSGVEPLFAEKAGEERQSSELADDLAEELRRIVRRVGREGSRSDA